MIKDIKSTIVNFFLNLFLNLTDVFRVEFMYALIVQYQLHIDMITIFDALMHVNSDADKIFCCLTKDARMGKSKMCGIIQTSMNIP